jgi:hypothetical protein
MGNIYFRKIQISGPAMNFALEKWREYQPPFRKRSGSLAMFAAIRRASSGAFLFWRDVQSVNFLSCVSGAVRHTHFNGCLLAILFG